MSGKPAASSLPTVLGRYEVVGHLATGGMAEILLGRLVGPSGFERPVVLKRILPHLARTRSFVDMFLDEARIVARIRHPNVVAVHELGREGEELYLVMEYVEGESLGGLMRRMWMRNEELGYQLAAHVVAEACAGLHAAHELEDDSGKKQHLVHRDVSPHNLMVTYSGQVKVLDFGIAKAADRITRTEAGQVKGKFEYMSPEQCRGRPLDRRSDVFALGVVLYELTTSRRLFKRSHELAALKAICEQPVVPPSRVATGYPPELERICMRALSRRREERYTTAADMRRDLLAALRTFEGSAMQEEALADLMRALFADRIEDKQDMLRRFRAGAALTSVPVAEPDETVEIPVFFDDHGSIVGDAHPDAEGDDEQEREAEAASPATTAAAATTRGSSRTRTPLLAGVLLSAAGAAALAAAWVFADKPAGDVVVMPSPSAAAPSPQPAVEPSGAPEAATSSAPTATSDAVVVRIETNPPGARVIVGGSDRGATPLELSLPRGGEPLEAVLQLDGFVPRAEQLTPNVDQRLVLSLQRVRASKPRPAAVKAAATEKPSAPVPPASAPPPAPPPAKPGFRRFD
jgi:serine/threonine-protein kinase